MCDAPPAPPPINPTLENQARLFHFDRLLTKMSELLVPFGPLAD